MRSRCGRIKKGPLFSQSITTNRGPLKFNMESSQTLAPMCFPQSNNTFITSKLRLQTGDTLDGPLGDKDYRD